MAKLKSAGIFLIVYGCLLFLQDSCASHEFPSYTCPDESVSFSEDISTIVETRCAVAGCHNGDGNPNGPGADRNWLDFETFQDHAQNGLVKTYVVNRIMPPSSHPPLSQAEIDAIACWIDQGAQAN